jgi:beta-lactam-binding protein with PASTA domain
MVWTWVFLCVLVITIGVKDTLGARYRSREKIAESSARQAEAELRQLELRVERDRLESSQDSDDRPSGPAET